ncbi:MAG: YebC/PmpR family DNA-binding transcriptional regulator [Bacteroidia bacterium]
MSGHNKWSKIKRKKGVSDGRRAKAFTRILKEIAISIKEGGMADPDANPRLRLAITNAKGMNMPKDNIQRAIQKAVGKDAANYTQVSYEGYAPGGVAVFVECTTDNINRTVADVRHAFTKNNGTLGTNGSLSFLFDLTGVFTIQKNNFLEDEMMLLLLDAGADDVLVDEEIFTAFTTLENFAPMQKKLEEQKIEIENAELQRIPKNTITLDIESAKKVLKMIDALEEYDDVQNVFHNMEMTDELIEAL